MWGQRILVLYRLLWLSFFSIFTVVAGNGVLIAVPQARETLYALSDGSAAETLRRGALLCAAYLYWGLCAWLVARLMLGRRFAIDRVGCPRELDDFAAACTC